MADRFTIFPIEEAHMKPVVSTPVNVLARQKGTDDPRGIATGALDVSITL